MQAKIVSKIDCSAKAWLTAYQKARQGSDSAMADLLNIAEQHIKSHLSLYKCSPADTADIAQEARKYVVETVRTKKEPILIPENYFRRGINYTIKHKKIELDKYYKRNDFSFNEVTNNGDEIRADVFIAREALNPRKIAYLKEVLSVIRKMPKKVQRILLAPVLEGKKSEEIAKELGMTAANVDQIKSRARKELIKKCEFYA